MVTFLAQINPPYALSGAFLMLSILSQTLLAQDAEPKRYTAPNTQNAYESISDALEAPEQVYSLNLSAQDFQQFPLEVTQLKNLHYLDLSGNQLQAIPSEIQKLENLHYLDLSNNQLAELPAYLKDLPKLQWINLKNNPMSEDQLALQSRHLPTIKGILYNFLERNNQSAVKSFYEAGLELLEQANFQATEKAEYYNLGANIFFWLNDKDQSHALSQKVLALAQVDEQDWKNYVPRSLLMQAKLHLHTLATIQSQNTTYQQQANQLELSVQNLQVLIEQIKDQRDKEKKIRQTAVALAKSSKEKSQEEQSKRLLAENILKEQSQEMNHISAAYRRYLIWIGLFALGIITYILYRNRQNVQEMYEHLTKQKNESAEQYRNYLNTSLKLKKVETELKIKADEVEVLKEIIEQRQQDPNAPEI